MPPAMTFRRQCMATPFEVRRMLVAFDAFLIHAQIHHSLSENLRLVTAEALNNVVEHAYVGQETGVVGLLCVVGKAGVACRISDRGRPLDQLPEGLAPDLRGVLPEGGFGWFLIRQLATRIRYRRHGRQNLLSFAVTCRGENREPPSKRPNPSAKAPETPRITKG